ncbi:Hypothetical protein CINCED_3A011345, partial [Cinara cedri]
LPDGSHTSKECKMVTRLRHRSVATATCASVCPSSAAYLCATPSRDASPIPDQLFKFSRAVPSRQNQHHYQPIRGI